MARFPAIDPEPPPRSLRQRLARAGAGAAVLAAVAAALVVVPNAVGGSQAPRAAPSPTPAAAAPGRVVVVDSLHLSITDSRGRLQRPLTADLAIDPSGVELVPDPSGRQGVTVGGFGSRARLLVDLARPLARTVPAVPADLLQDGDLPDAPWVDGGRSLVLVSGPVGGEVGLVDVATGAVARLGSGVGATGDPSARAVVVAAGGRPLPAVEGNLIGSTFTRIERLEPGRPPVVLHTAAQLTAETGLPKGEPLLAQRLSVSPDGRYVLVGVDTAGSREFPRGLNNPPRLAPAGALVVLDRSGRTVAVRRSVAGRGLDWVRWSSGGRLAMAESVATDVVNLADHVLSSWDLRTPPREIPLPGSFQNTLLTTCAWSPPGDRLLCGDDRGWFDVTPATGAVELVQPVTGRPLAWLP